jgi:hypothetical protein
VTSVATGWSIFAFCRKIGRGSLRTGDSPPGCQSLCGRNAAVSTMNNKRNGHQAVTKKRDRRDMRAPERNAPARLGCVT